jgi:hypothetical protein
MNRVRLGIVSNDNIYQTRIIPTNQRTVNGEFVLVRNVSLDVSAFGYIKLINDKSTIFDFSFDRKSNH